MKYETPELTALTPAINAIQGTGTTNKEHIYPFADSEDWESVGAYADWE